MRSLFSHDFEGSALSQLAEGAVIMVPDILKRLVKPLADFTECHTFEEKQLQGRSLLPG